MILKDIEDRDPPVPTYKTAQKAEGVSVEDILLILTEGKDPYDETETE